MMQRLASGSTEKDDDVVSRVSRSEPPSVNRAVGLGLFSLGLGFAELFMPERVARLIGVKANRQTCLLLQALGAREIASGVGLLARPTSATWIWSRVAGDVIDLALLGESLFSPRVQHGRIAGAAAAVLGVAAVDAVSAAQVSREPMQRARGGAIHVTESITVNRPPSEVYDFWRDLENLPRFMDHLESVKITNGTSKWRAKGPAGLVIEWDAEVILDQPNQCIGWRSLRGTSVPNQGVVRFQTAPGGRGTEILVDLSYEPPAGSVGKAFAKLFGEEPAQQVAADLRRLKQVLETGEVVHSDASIHRGMHAAQPTQDNEANLKGGRST